MAVNELEGIGESQLLAFKRFLLSSLERRRDKLEADVSKGEMHRATVVQGGIEELRHLVAAIDSELRARRKGT